MSENRPDPGAAESPSTSPQYVAENRNPMTVAGQAPATGSGQAPATGSGQAPATGSGQTPATGSGQTPATGSGQAPSTGSGQAPATGSEQAAAPTAEHPRAGRARTNTSLRTWMVVLLGLGIFLVLLLMLWGAGVIGLPGRTQAAVPTPVPQFTDGADSGAMVLGANAQASAAEASANIPPPGSGPGVAPAVSARFQGYYDARGGLRVLGRPISEPMVVNGREIQWFERARLEHWPEYAGTLYEIQLGRLGVEYTAGRDFAQQTYFASRPDLRFFPETGHAVGGLFLAFWERNGGLDAFGLPISEEFDEVLPDGRAYRVQYFERARFELHPEAAGTDYEVQLGLLGTALLSNENRPTSIQPAPSPVPMP